MKRMIMCGIIGVISRRERRPMEASTFIAMRDSMTLRGPDDCGLYQHENVWLGHRRLAIRDPASGSQPWHSQNGQFILVYNGEIYNDRDVALELASHGVALRTRCDTEVLAEAWAQWGIAALARLRGMFAFAIYDRKSKQLWLVRDRLGVKPLFYASVAGDFVFASSIAAIRRHPQFSSQPDMLAVSHYLQTLRVTLGSHTMYQDVHTLMPGEVLRVDGRYFASERFWDLPLQSTQIHAKPEEASFQAATDAIGTTIRDSVRAHLQSDVQVGMMMSGGVDSNTIATVVRDELGPGFTGVCGGGIANSAASGNAAKDDFHFARDCANLLGADYAEARLTATDYRDSWQSMLRIQELPLATPTDAVIYLIAKQIRKSCGVALGGEGADEAFCGYAIQHWSGHDFDRSRTLQPLDHLRRQQIEASLQAQYGQTQFSSLAEHYFSANGLIGWDGQACLFQPGFYSPDFQYQIESYYESLFDPRETLSTAQRYLPVLLQANLESLLSRLEGATMAASLEARVPYADHIVVEQALALPHAYKIDLDPGESEPWLSSLSLASRGSLRCKRVLRSAARQWLPERLAYRPKSSFPTPLVSWLGNEFSSWICDRLQNSEFARTVFRPEAIEEICRNTTSLTLWRWPVMNLVLWGDDQF